MFPLSHIVVSTRVLGRCSDLLVLGSVIPDGAWIVPRVLPRSKIHDDAAGFDRYVKLNYWEYADLGLGVKLHALEQKGADYYSDDEVEGFAVNNCEELGVEVSEIRFESRKSKISLLHNYVEAAVELQVASNHAEVVEWYGEAIAGSGVGVLVKVLADYLGLELEEVRVGVEQLFGTLSLQNLTRRENIVRECLWRFGKMKCGEGFTQEMAERLLDRSARIVEGKWEQWLENAVEMMRGEDWG
jgi:hypothetical protein